MTLPINPPPLSVPGELSRNRQVAAFFDSLLRTIYQMWSELRGIEFTAKTTTTDASNTALQRVAVATDRTVLIEARVLARRTGGSAGSAGDSAGYVVRGTFKNVSGTVSLVGSVNADYTAEDQSGWNCGFAVSGQEVQLIGTGAANNNITWESAIKVYEVGV